MKAFQIGNSGAQARCGYKQEANVMAHGSVFGENVRCRRGWSTCSKDTTRTQVLSSLHLGHCSLTEMNSLEGLPLLLAK